VPKPRSWSQFGKLIDEMLNADFDVTISILNPNSDPPFSEVSFDNGQTFGADTDLFNAAWEAAEAAKKRRA
jgi:hypothetical protein